MARLRDTAGGGGGGSFDALGAAATVKTEVEADLTTERTAREAAVTAEATTRSTADSAEKTARETAIATVSSSISAETTRAKAAEKTESEERSAAVATETAARKTAITNAEAVAAALVTAEEAARIASAATKIPLSQKGVANGVAELDGSGKLPTAQLPALALTDPFVVGSEAAQLALTTHVGDIVVRTDTSKTYIRLATALGTMADFTELLFAAPVVSVNGKTGAVTVTYTDVGADKAGSSAAAQAAAEGVANAETTRAKAAEKVNSEGITTETARAKAAEETNSANITTAKGEVATEKSAREAGDTAEATARSTADSTEKTARETGDSTEKSARETAVTNEATSRVAGDALANQKSANLSDVGNTGTARLNLRSPWLTAATVVATTNQAALEGLKTIDGVTLEAEQTVLLTGQTTASQNGQWQASAGAWTRPTDYATGFEIKNARLVYVIKGTTGKGTIWALNYTGTVTIDTTAQTWELYKRIAKTINVAAWSIQTPAVEELPGITFESDTGQKQFLVAIRVRTVSGECEVEVKRNGTGVTSLTAVKPKSSPERIEANAGTPIELTNGDYFTLNVKTNAAAKGLSVTLVTRSEA